MPPDYVMVLMLALGLLVAVFFVMAWTRPTHSGPKNVWRRPKR